MEVPQKVKLEPPYQPLIALLSVYPPKIQKHKSKGYMHPYIYSSIYNSRIIEVSNCPLTDEWVNKLRHLPRNRSQSQRKEELQPQATIWMNLECIMLGDVSPTQADKSCTVVLT